MLFQVIMVHVDVVSHFRRSPKRLLHRSGIVAALAACSLSFLPSLWAASPCALTGDTPVSTADVTAAINMALGTATCASTLEHNPPVCTVVTVQRVTNAYLGSTPAGYATPCIVFNAHAANLSWTASTTSTVTAYNVYRATASAGPYTNVGSSISATTYCSGSSCAWSDSTVVAGTTYYYEVTAVANGVESAPTSPVQAPTIPSP
jgi:hypothetical protein